MNDNSSKPDNVVVGLLILGLVGFIGFIVFMVTVVGPSHDNRRERCESKGGVIVSGGACIDKKYVL